MSSLVLADRVVIEPIGAPVQAPTSRRRLGRSPTLTVRCRGIVEFGSKKRDRPEGGVVREQSLATLYLDPREIARHSYTPAEGDRLVSVTWHQTGRTETLNLYLAGGAVTIGAGDVLQAPLTDRTPGRVGA